MKIMSKPLNLWHDSRELPIDGKCLIGIESYDLSFHLGTAEYDPESGITFFNDEFGDAVCTIAELAMWAYVTDILAIDPEAIEHYKELLNEHDPNDTTVAREYKLSNLGNNIVE